jgi:isoleucyl-tRNA synthetase
MGGTIPLEVAGTDVTIEPDDVTVEREVAGSWLVQSDGAFVAALDPQLDDSLRAEGIARELVNRIQRLRKEAGYEFTTRIVLWLDGDAGALVAARAHENFLKEETLARVLHFGARAAEPDLEQLVDIDGAAVWVGMQRHDTP